MVVRRYMALLLRPPSTGLASALGQIVGADRVSIKTADRLAYSYGACPRDLLLLRQGLIEANPDVVVWPRNSDEVARILRFSAENGIPVVPYGVGSGLVGGTRPSQGGITIDLKQMRAVRRLETSNFRVEVETGILGSRLEKYLNRHGFTLGHFPASIQCSTLGGWLATRSAGQMSTLYGKIEDMTLGAELVTPEGVRRWMPGTRPKGIDWLGLILGSEGTFGVTNIRRT